MAAAFIAGIIACREVDTSIEEPMLTASPETFTMSISATKDDYAMTRGLSLDDHTVDATWAAGGTVDVYQPKQAPLPGTVSDYREYYEKIGTLTVQAGGATATLSGTVTMPASKTNLMLCYGSPSYDYRGQAGTLEDISAHYDYASVILFKNKYNLENGEITLVNPEKPLNFANKQAVVKFILKDAGGNGISVSSLNIGATDGYKYNVAYSIPTESAEEAWIREAGFTVTAASATNEFYVAMPEISNLSAFPIRLEASNSGFNYFYEQSDISFTKGRYYEMTVTMKRPAETIDLSTLSGHFVAEDGDVLTGTLDGTTQKVKVSIADGATVTLNGVTINGVSVSEHLYEWSGITCLGDATLVLAEGTTNTVRGFERTHPGIQPAVGKTLTIEGTGTLNASSNGEGPGIGCSFQGNCGNIHIKSGIINATGGSGCAAIGNSANDCVCGNITISGGNVTANAGKDAAAIGCGVNDGYHNGTTCGDILIEGGTTVATNTESSSAAVIGCTFKGTSCKSVTVTTGITSLTMNNPLRTSLEYYLRATAVHLATYDITSQFADAVYSFNKNDAAFKGLFPHSTYDRENEIWVIAP